MSKALGLPQAVFVRAFKGNQTDIDAVIEVLEQQQRVSKKWLAKEAAKERENLQKIIKYQDKSISALEQLQDLLESKNTKI